MAVNPNSGSVISLEEAIQFTQAYQEANPDAIKAYFAGTDKLNLILEQEGCIGIRVYNGLDSETGKGNQVLVGVTGEGEDMTDGVILERLYNCPIFCPKNSKLIIER